MIMQITIKLRFIVLGLLLATFTGFSSVPEDGRFPKDPKVAVLPEYADYFKDSYQASRLDFLIRAEVLSLKFKGTEKLAIAVPSKETKELFVDVFYIPALKNSENLLVISCGTHGVEGYAGSAIQRMIMEKYITPENLENTGVLLIHAMNPYGFSRIRRVTENNVDMNRNCDATADLFNNKNEGYTKLYKFINPDKRASLGSFQNRLFVERAILKIVKATMPVLRQAVLQGQYQYPEGLYYGGKEFEHQVIALKPNLIRYASGYNRIIHIDLHTGYGARGKMHLFPNPALNKNVKEGTEKLFEGYQIDWGDSKNFYTITGDFSNLIGKMLPEKLVIPMTLEYGTMDSQKTMGSLRSIQNMILENQGFHHGYKNERSERKIKGWLQEMYAPSSPVWRTMVMEQSNELMGKVFNRVK
jgi:hypothetical protein